MEELIKDNRIWFGKDGTSKPRFKRFRSEVRDTIPAQTIWGFDEVGHTDEGTKEVARLFGGTRSPFPNPKPVRLIQRVIEIASSDDDIVLDFFAGSATTAHSLFKQNYDDGKNRKFILVQLNEHLDPNRKEHAATIACCQTLNRPLSIAEVTKERIRLAGKQIQEDERDENNNQDFGFRVLRIDTSNMTEVYYSPDQIQQDSMFDQVGNTKEDRTDEDLLFQVLLDWGVDLSLPIRQETIHNQTVFFVDENALVACFGYDVNEALVKELAGYNPVRVVFRDNGFASDAVKINVEQIFRQLSPSTEVKSI